MNKKLPKAIVFDADGMIIRGERFSTRFSRQFNVPIEKINPFFEKEFQDCLVGKRDLVEALSPYLERWNWKKGIDELIHFWFAESYKVDEEMLRVVEKVKESGIVCILATNQEKRRVSYMKNEMGLAYIFDHIIASSDVGHRKNSPSFFRAMLERVRGILPHEMLFFDDRQENVEAAKRFGFEAHLFTGIKDFRTVVGI
jgi:putative hydrolase of the HAD superfamily